MMRIVLDTNVIIDCLARREPFYDAARKLMMFGAVGEYEMWISGSQLSDVFYLLSSGDGKSAAEATKTALRDLRKHVRIYSIGEAEVDAALASTWEDVEDSIVHQTAVRLGASAIVTRNTRDFEQSSVPVMDADGFFAWLGRTKGVFYDEVPF